MDGSLPLTRRRVLHAGAAALGGLVAGGCRPATPVSAAEPTSKVERMRTPDGGVQPQAVVDSRGTIHLVYLQGKPGASDVFYRRRAAGEKEWSPAVRVNSQPGSAVAAGTIRGAQFALGKGDRVHVVWNGSMEASPRSERGALLFYSRLDDTGKAFEPQRDVSRTTVHLDGGASIAADPRGNVYVAWHAAQSKDQGEGARRLWLTRSGDDGKTFGPEETIWEDPTGACACCSVKIFADQKGAVYVFYRAATERVNRDMVFLASGPGAARFQGGKIDPWVINACPMASESLVEGPDGVWGAWETEGQVRFARVDGSARKLGTHVSAPGPAAGRKHPFLAVNPAGEVLLVWDEGTGWQRGGALAWQLYDRTGKPLAEKGRAEGAIPVWGLATAVPLPGGRFLVIH